MKIGIDIGGSHIGIGLISDGGRILEKIETELTNNNEEEHEKKIVQIIIEQINILLEKAKVNIKQIELIGIAVPGTVSEMHIVKAENLHIKNFNIVSEINKYYNLKIQLRNDAKCAAMAEKEYGSLKKVDDAIFLTIGTGIGGAVFLGGELLKPKRYEGFEIGHMVIEKNGIKCNCKRKGCFEKYASMKALKDKIKEVYNNQNLTSKEIYNILVENKDDEKFSKIIDEYIENLSIGIENLINIFEPEKISLGGSFVYYKDIFLDKLEKKLQEEDATFNTYKRNTVIVAKLKNDAGIIGATL